MENPQLQNLIYNLTEIQNLCNKLIDMDKQSQNDTELLKVLKSNYTLSKDEMASILSTVNGKIKSAKKSKDDSAVLKTKLEAFCVIADISCNDENGNLFPYKKIKDKATAKKSIANDKLKSLSA